MIDQQRMLEFVISQVPQDIAVEIDEQIRGAYLQADVTAKQILKRMHPGRLRAQLRRDLVNDALAHVGEVGQVHDTTPKGEQYAVLPFEYLSINTLCLHRDEWARPAKHRTLLASLNEQLEPTTRDMFDPTDPQELDRLHAAILVIHPRSRAKSQSAPFDIQFVIPYTNWRGYHMQVSLDTLLQAYAKEQVATAADLAWPQFKAGIIETEKQNSG